MGKIKKKPVVELKPTKSLKKSFKRVRKGKKNDFTSMSVDAFLEKNFEGSDSDSGTENSINAEELEKTPELAENDEIRELSDESDTNIDEIEENADESGNEIEMRELSDESDTNIDQTEENADESGDEIEQHKEALSKLKDTDPEFYKFLEENDRKLLQFNVSDDEAEEDSQVDNQLHKLPEDLELASDESDFEDSDVVRGSGTVTLKMLKNWESSIQTDTTNQTITMLIQAFHGALLRVSNNDEAQGFSVYKVDSSAVFNGVIQVCVLHLGPALKRFLGIKHGSKQPPHKCKKFVKVKGVLKEYFTDLCKLLSGVTSPNIQTVLLKHLHYLSSFLVSFPSITKLILKRLILIWGTGDEGVRVLAFLCILRITNSQKVKFLDTALKAMYMTYVKNSKFMSLGTLAAVNFMRRSLVEMFALDPNVAYQHVFLYLRQLAIYLRNAITANKKESIQAVYNWQYINSLKLWANLLSVANHKSQLNQLIYPLVQVCLGVLKLAPTTQYFPLRFHVVQILMNLSRDTNIFIPILPFILEVLTTYDFNKKHLKVSMKPLQFTCLLRVSKSQLSENGFKDALIENCYSLLLEYLSNNSSSISFPDLSLLCLVQLKQFIKQCSNVKYNRKIKQLVEKVEQNSQFIDTERKQVRINITDFNQIEGWESKIKTKGTPLSVFYENWLKMYTMKKNKQLTNNEELGEYNLPTIKKKSPKVRSEGPVELFPSDSEEDTEDNDW